MPATIVRTDDQSAEVRGDLLNSTVVPVLEQGNKLLAAATGQWTVSLAAVDKVSSAGVALLLEWMREAEKRSVTLRIADLPEHMRPIISISDLDPLFDSVLI